MTARATSRSRRVPFSLAPLAPAWYRTLGGSSHDGTRPTPGHLPRRVRLPGGRRYSTCSSFVTFETGQVRPLALSPDDTHLYALNTPDDRLEIFDVDPQGNLAHSGSVPVGLEPVAAAAHGDGRHVWVVNHLSDSVSIIDVSSSPPRVVRTLLVGDEPRDIVFAGPGGNAPSSPPRTADRTAGAAGGLHHRRHRTRRRVGVRRDEPRQRARRHAAHQADALRRHAACARRQPRGQHRLRGGLPVREPDHGAERGSGVRRRRDGRLLQRRRVHHGRRPPRFQRRLLRQSAARDGHDRQVQPGTQRVGGPARPQLEQRRPLLAPTRTCS